MWENIKPLPCDYEMALRIRKDPEVDTKELSIYRAVTCSTIADAFGIPMGELGMNITNASDLDYEFALRMTGDHELDAYEISIFRESLLDAMAEVLKVDVHLLRNALLSLT